MTAHHSGKTRAVNAVRSTCRAPRTERATRCQRGAIPANQPACKLVTSGAHVPESEATRRAVNSTLPTIFAWAEEHVRLFQPPERSNDNPGAKALPAYLGP